MNKRININKFLIILLILVCFSTIVFSQEVKLSWTPNPANNISHYQIYRSVRNQAGFSLLGSTEKADSTFIDTDVTVESQYFYAVATVNHSGAEGELSDMLEITIPKTTKPNIGFELHQNYPNPFNPSTNIHFSVTTPQFVTIKIYDIRGVEIKTLLKEHMNIGNHTISLNGVNLMNGVYIVRFHAGGAVETRKIILLK